MGIEKLRRIFGTRSLKIVVWVAGLAVLPAQQASAYLIEIHKLNDSGIVSLAQADAIIATAGSLVSSSTNDIIEFDDLGDGTTGQFSINNPWPGGVVSSFAVHVTGTISTGAGTFTYGLNHDDGARLMIDGTVVASADGVVDNRNTFGTIALAAGLHSVDIVFFENFGGASLEFFERTAAGLRLVRSVPEPSTLGLIGLALLGFGLIRRRRA